MKRGEQLASPEAIKSSLLIAAEHKFKVACEVLATATATATARRASIAAPARGGFSAFAATAPILAALHEADGFEKIGAALVAVIEAQTGLKLSPKDAVFEAPIFEALSLIFEPHFSPSSPLEKKGKGKENLSLSLPQRYSEKERKGSQSFAPSFEDWEAHCLSIGWAEKAEYTASFRSQESRLGWGGVKSWKGLAGCFHRNAIAKAEKAERINGAFAQKGGVK